MAALRIRPSILLFGDSITQMGWGVDGHVGWVSLLASAYTRRADVVNRGFSGYNTRHALDVLPRMFDATGAAKQEMLFCTIFLGANDAALPGEDQHVPLEEFKSNLIRMVQSIRENSGQPTIPIILITPPPVDEKAWAAHMQSFSADRKNHVSRTYGQSCLQVAAEHDCAVLDVYDLLGGDSGDCSKHLSDGLHLSESGNVLVYEGLMGVIKEKYPNLAPMEDGDGKHGASGIPVEEALWRDLC